MEIRGLNRGDRQGRERTWRAYDTDKYCPGNDDSNAQRIDNDANQERTHEIQDLLARIERLERSYNTCANPRTNRSAEVECYDLGHYARDCPRRQGCDTDVTQFKLEPSRRAPLNIRGPSLAAKERSQ